MNRKLFSFACLTFAFLLIALSPAAALPPGGSCYCDTGYVTGMNWGMGSTCSAANTDLRNHLLAEASGICEWQAVCSFQVQYTNYCSMPVWDVFQSDGYATFGCRACPGTQIP